MFNLSKTALYTKGELGDINLIIVDKDTIYIFGANDKIDNILINQLCRKNKLNPIDYIHSSPYNLARDIKEQKVDLLWGELDNIHHTLYIQDGAYLETHNYGSNLLKNVVKQLNIQHVKLKGGEDDEELQAMRSDEITGNIPDIFYHGTNSSVANNILRFGLQPNEDTNHPGIFHKDKVFFTSKFPEACSHAVGFRKERKGFPVVFEIKVPDKNLLVPDYDVENLVTKNRRSTYRTKLKYNKNLLKKDPFTLSKNFGTFGYKGRIPASFITRIFIYNDINDENYMYPDNWIQVTPKQLNSAIEYGGPEFYDYDEYCHECMVRVEDCECERCPKCKKIMEECYCDNNEEDNNMQEKWSAILETSKPLIKISNTALINNQKRFEIEISDTDRYTSDKYEVVLALTHTIRGHCLGFQLNSAQLGVASYVEYWHYKDSDKNLAENNFNTIKKILTDVAQDIQYNSPPMATVTPYFRHALSNIDIEHKEKSGVYIYNKYLETQDSVKDYRASIYGNRFKNNEIGYIGENWINNDDKSKKINAKGDGRNLQFNYKQSSADSFYKDAEIIAMDEKIASWNLPKNLILPFLMWLNLNYGILPAQAQDIATSQPTEIQQKIEEFKKDTENKNQSKSEQHNYSDKFKKCLALTLKFEGGYSNNPNDKGGETNFGITKNTYENYLKQNKINKSNDVKQISKDEVEQIYHNMYWNAIHGDQLPEPVAIQMFDYAVHSGPKQAIQSLQKSLKLKETGVFDNNIIQLLNKSKDHFKDAKNLLNQRKIFLHNIVKHNKKQSVFTKGWNARCESLSKYIHPEVTKSKKMPIVPNSLKERCDKIPEQWTYNFTQQTQLFT